MTTTSPAWAQPSARWMAAFLSGSVSCRSTANPPPRSDELPCRLERPLERVGSVRVVHDDEEGLSGLDALEAARNRADGAQRAADGLGRHAESHAHARGRV